ncbi:MAG TPA: hypothetical protein VKT80_00385, partial [Chloroflexota bacterium]|nr:hypothetical protein [Chloroflexota bacterium]
MAVNVPLLLTGQIWHTYDFPTHLFFASHYQHDWWSLWEPRWFEGFDVASYPPLPHQLAALLGWIIGDGNAINLLTFGSVVCLPVSTYFMAKSYIGPVAASRSAALAVVIPSVLFSAYSFGQLPTLFALDTSLFAATALGGYMRRGSVGFLFLLIALIGTTVASHHATFIFLGPPLFGCIFVAEFLASHERSQTVVRMTVATIASVGVAIVAILPFWIWHATEYVAQTAIDHASRHDFLTDPASQKVFFWSEHGILIAAIGLAVPLVFRRPKQLVPWYGLAVGMMVIGLGGTTPVPRLLFGDQWNWLTYDRFSLWSDVGMVVLFGALASSILDRPGRPSAVASFAWWFTLVGLGAYGVTDALRPTLISTLPPPIDLKPIVTFLESDGRDQWRYLTLGFGEQAGILNAQSTAQTVDGYFFTARRIPILTESGIGQIDRNLDLDPKAKVTHALLRDPAPHALK